MIAPYGLLRNDGEGRIWHFHPDRPATRDGIQILIAAADDATGGYGRELYPVFAQANVFEAKDFLRVTNGCTPEQLDVQDSLGICTSQR